MIKNNVINWSISSNLIVQEAKKIGATIHKICPEKNLFSISIQGHNIFFKNIDCWMNTAFGLKVTEDKELTYALLGMKRIPTALSYYLKKNEWITFLEDKKMSFPLVVKPVDGAHGDGVSIDLQTRDDLERAIDFARKYSDTIIVQSYITGYDHRVLVVWEQVIAVAKREPASIIGDGTSTIQELIDQENQNPLRGSWDHNSPLTTIKIDNEVINFLKKNNSTLDTIIEYWAQVFLRWNANLSTGWKAIDLTDSIHPSVAQYAIESAKTLWLTVAWVDILTDNIALPLEKTRGVIIEVNSTPWLRMHHYPSSGKSRNAARAILELLCSMKNITI